MDFANGEVPDEDKSLSVINYVGDDGNWKWGALEDNLPVEVLDTLAITQIPHSAAGKDEVYWKLSPDGKLSVSSAYQILNEDSWREKNGVWRLIWSWPGPERVRTFLWLAAHEKLLTNCERKRRHLTELDSCAICRIQEENVLHVLRDCPVALAVWLQINPTLLSMFLTEGSAVQWISQNIAKREKDEAGSSWAKTFETTCWTLWKWRNSTVFQEGFNRPPNAKDCIFHFVQAIGIAKKMQRKTLYSHRC